jgi:hypothetical protein
MSFIAHLLTDFSKPSSGEAPPFLKQVAPEPDRQQIDDTTALIRAAETKARTEEREIARKNLEDALAAERARFEGEMTAQRASWAEQEGLQLAVQWAETFTALEGQVSDRVAKILRPFLAEAYREQAIASLTEALRSVLSSARTKVIKVSGPDDILSAIRDRLGSHGEAFEFVPSETVEIVAVADDTIIETQLQSWSGRLGEVFKDGR